MNPSLKDLRRRRKMDNQGTVGIVGFLTSIGLADYHLVAASAAATFTAVYMVVATYKKLKDK
jgi:hypothetical protein